MEEKKLVPKLRFPGFTEPWEQRKLGDVIASLYNGQTPSRFDKANWEGDIPWLTSGELNRGVVNHSIEKITPQGRDDANLKIVPKGTVVIAITGLEAAGTRGNCAKLGFDTTLNQSCMAIYPKSEFLDPDFLFQWYIAVGEEYGIKYTQGTKQQSYNAELIKILPISVPRVTEQRKITRILDSFDDIITLHQRKLEHLKLKKKSLLQKLFPKEGEVYPEFRFPGFTDPWEQRKLGELADGVFGGGTPKTSIDTYWNGSIPWIQSSNLMDDKIENFINDKSITNLAIKESATKLIPANSIAIVTRVGVGKVALIREKFATSQDFLSFHCRHEHNPLFMSYQISRLMKVKSRLLQGTSIKGITKSEVLESEVLIPKGIEEENKIADFLSSCDNLITLHQEESFLHKYML